MGVIHIREENPWDSFLRGLSPAVEAWGNRYQERHKMNVQDDVKKFLAAQPKQATMQDLLTEGYQYQEAKPQYFEDDIIGVNSSVDDLIRAYSSPNTNVGSFDQANAAAAQQVMNMQNADAKLAEMQAQNQAAFDAQQAQERLRISKKGAGVYGAQGMEDLFNSEAQKLRLGQINPNTSYNELISILEDDAAQRGDYGALAKIADIKAPNTKYSTVNLGGQTMLVGYDPKNPDATNFQYFDNSMNPYQEAGLVEKGKDRDFRRWEIESGRDFTAGENAKNRENKYGRNAGYSSAEINTANSIIKDRDRWMKDNPDANEMDYPYYDDYLDALYIRRNVIGGGSGNGGSRQPSPQPQPPNQPGNYSVQELPTNEYQQIMEKVRADAKAQGINLTNNDIMMILEDQFNIKWKSSAR